MYVHPLHNFAVVAYDPQPHRHDAGEGREALTPRELTPGEPVWVVGLGGDSQMHARSHRDRQHRAAASCRCRAPCASATATSRPSQLVNPPRDFDGVLADEAGNVLGTWSSFAYDNGRELAQDTRGVPIDLVADMLDRVRTGRPLHSLEAELVAAAAGQRAPAGLSEELGAAPRAAHPHARARC